MVAEDLRLRQLLVPRDAHLVPDLSGGELLLGASDHGDLGDRVDAIGERQLLGVTGAPEHGQRGAPSLLHGGGRQGGKADGVARREDVRHRRAELVVDRHTAARVRFQARGGKIELVRVRLPSHRIEEGVRRQRLVALQPRHDAPGIHADGLHLLAEPEDRFADAHVIRERVDDLPIDEVEQRRPLIDYRGLDVQRGEHRGVFQSDHAGADHDGAAGHLDVERDQLVAVEDAFPVARDVGVPRRARAAGDQHVLRLYGPRPLVRLHGERVRSGEARRSLQHRDSVAAQLVAHHLQLVLAHLADATVEIRHGDDLLQHVVAPVEGALPEAGEVEDGLAQRLARDRARVQRHAAQALTAIDDGHFLAQLGRADGPFLARRSAADHHQVVGVFHRVADNI